MTQAKTNAMRLLEQAGISYAPHEYETAGGALDGVSVAHKTGMDEAKVFKTLVAKAADGRILVFCIPVAAGLDLKKAARAAGAKNVAMLPLSELTRVIGYVKGGCSPVGMKKPYPTYLHESAAALSTVAVSGGRVGLQIELAPSDLVRMAAAAYADLVV